MVATVRMCGSFVWKIGGMDNIEVAVRRLILSSFKLKHLRVKYFHLN
jgi:hypothetical protein